MKNFKSTTTCIKAIAVITSAFALNVEFAHAHGKGMYTTQAAAEARAKELNCEGTHENNGKWMPCRDEADLHKALRKQ